MGKAKRTQCAEVILVRVTPAEKARIRRAAKEAGRSMSGYLRNLGREDVKAKT